MQGSSVLVSFCFLAVLLGASGCTPTQAHVSGEVSLDGVPLKEGVITFIPADGKSQTAAAIITNGSYSTEVPPVKMRVEITASEVVGERTDIEGPGSKQILKEIIPDCYNRKSELTVDLKPGAQKAPFALTRKGS